MAFDAFLKIDGIEGESRDARYPRQLDVLSYSFGVSNAGSAHTGTGGAAGKAEFTDVNFVVYQSKATIPLLMAAASGQHIKQADLAFRKAGDKGQEFYRVTMTDVVVTSVHESGTNGEDRLTNALSLSFSKVQWSYTQQMPDGTAGDRVTGGWDLRQNSKI